MLKQIALYLIIAVLLVGVGYLLHTPDPAAPPPSPISLVPDTVWIRDTIITKPRTLRVPCPTALVAGLAAVPETVSVICPPETLTVETPSPIRIVPVVVRDTVRAASPRLAGYIGGELLSDWSGRLLDPNNKRWAAEIGLSIDGERAGWELVPLQVARSPDRWDVWLGIRGKYYFWRPGGL